MVRMFQEKMAGDGNDSDALIVQAFKGKIDFKMFQHALMTCVVHKQLAIFSAVATSQGAAAAASRTV